MGRFWVPVVVLAAVSVAGTARGQDGLFRGPQVFDPAASGVQYLVEPTDTVLLGVREPGERARPAPSFVGGVRGTVGGQAVSNQVNASVGFTYLVPLWTFGDFQLAVPRGFEGAFPVFGAAGRVDSIFAYAPRVNLDYYVADLDFSVGTSGTFLNLTGRVDRQATSRELGVSQLTANSSLTLVSADLIEFGRRYAFLDLFPHKDPKHEAVADSVVDFRLGTRYVSVDQNYTGTLLGGPTGQNVATRFSTQTFRGLGITAASIWTVPWYDNWAPYFSARQSLLLGENRRNSSVTVTAQGFPALADTQYDNRTSLVPVTELELGFDLVLSMVVRLRGESDPPLFNIRVAAVGQYWGGLGPLSAGTSQNFRRSDLFMVGGYIQAGFKY